MKIAKKVALPVPTKNFAERCKSECTGNVIFLLQSRFLKFVDMPYGWEFDDDCSCLLMTEEDADYSTEEQEKQFKQWQFERKDTPYSSYNVKQPEISLEELYKLNDEHFVENWDTQSVWLEREEAEEFAKRTEYRYPQGWRVYGVNACGNLATLIKET